MRLLPILLVLVALAPARAQDRAEIVNKSGQPWTLALVEGTRPGIGTLKLVDKFSGRTTGVLTQVGHNALLPPQSRLLLEFTRENGYLYRHFILRDRNGYYGEYSATVEFLSTPRITIHLVDQHVGPPLDHADEAAVKQFLADAIEVESESIIIHPNVLGSPQSGAPLLATTPGMPRVPPAGK